MAYQPLWVIWYQSDLSRRTAVILFKVSLFNGLSTFMGYLKPKLSLKKNSSDSIQSFFIQWHINLQGLFNAKAILKKISSDII